MERIIVFGIRHITREPDFGNSRELYEMNFGGDLFMSLLSVWVIKNENEKIKAIVFSGDSLLTLKTESDKIENKFKAARKIFKLSPNIYLGFAGDFTIANITNSLKKSLNTKHENKEKYFESANKLSNYVYGKCSEYYQKNGLKETDAFLFIRDLKTKMLHIEKFEFSTNQRVMLTEGIHVIGSSAQVRGKFKQDIIDYIEKEWTTNTVSPIGHYSIPIRKAYINVIDDEVGDLSQCLYLDTNENYYLGNAFSDNDGETFLATGMNGDEFEYQVNGRTAFRTESDLDKIYRDLRKV